MRTVIGITVLLAALSVLGYTALNFYDRHFKFGRMWETPAVRPYEQPIAPLETGLVPTGGGETRLRSMDPARLVSPVALDDPQNVRLGRTVYFTYCVHCHGRHHDGNGTVGQSFTPLPGDLQSRRVQGLAPGILFNEISYGIPGGRQPPLATTMAAAERWQVIAYIKSLGTRP